MFNWKIFDNTLDGKALILGPGFDYKMMILSDDENLIIRYQRPSRKDEENHPYDSLEEIILPLSKLKELLNEKI